MKKRCPECGRNRRLDKRFYNNKSTKDKKQGICKDCQLTRNKEDRKTENYRKLKRIRDKKWKQDNKDWMKDYNAQYYKKYKERVMARRNTESILIIENGSKKSINRTRNKTPKYIPDDIVINPQRRKDG